MNIVSDKIFVTVFTAFIAVITTASVIIAKNPLHEEPAVTVELMESLHDDGLLPVKKEPKFEVISAEELLGGNGVTLTTPVTDDIKHKVDVVVGKSVERSQCVVLSVEQLEAVITKAIKAGLAPEPDDIVPTWKRVLSWAWFGIKLPYQALIMVPAEVRILVMLYFILKFKPEFFGWGIKEVVKHSPGLGKFLFKEFGLPMAEEMSHVIVDGIKVNVAEFLPTSVIGGMASATATAAEATARLANTWMPEWIQNFAIARGY